jgi:hypothetical protein
VSALSRAVRREFRRAVRDGVITQAEADRRMLALIARQDQAQGLVASMMYPTAPEEE